MSELNYKELQEQGVFDVPYKAFEYMQKQHKKIKELEMINFDSELHFDAARELPEFYKFYEAGKQSKQAEIDNLKKRIDDLITSIDWHIEDCELWLSMNKNDSWKGGQLEILKAIKKRFSK